MREETAKQILRLLSTFYPKTYPENMKADLAMGYIQDYLESYSKYKDDSVIRAYKEWHQANEKPPTIANIKSMMTTEDLKPDDSPVRYSEPFEDDDGCVYAKNSKTKDWDCIWKPWWAEERKVRIGGIVKTLPAKSKVETLAACGIRY